MNFTMIYILAHIIFIQNIVVLVCLQLVDRLSIVIWLYNKKIGNNLLTTKNVISTLQDMKFKTGPYALSFIEGE